MEQMRVSRSLEAMREKHGLIRAIKLHPREPYKTLVSSAMLTRHSIITMQLHYSTVCTYTTGLPLRKHQHVVDHVMFMWDDKLLRRRVCNEKEHAAWCGISDDGLRLGCRLTLGFLMVLLQQNNCGIYYKILEYVFRLLAIKTMW